ncbi:Hint domain-containing protein [Falsihalocynthiibacter sp. SS001]|uniref:Hint domain-containing protein n=1 Tax=Falsihalocynthiibacter sp. SS001 TaxID=3349698 RepID=UPI0036D2D910
MTPFEMLAQKIVTDERAPTGVAGESMILTARGEVRASDLRIGDRVVTRDAGMRLLRSIKTFRSTNAYRIRAGVVGVDRPTCDLLVTAGQRILIRDWRAKALFGVAQALVPASRLADGHFIAREADADQTFFALRFDAPHILYIDGLEAASASSAKVTA